MTKLKSVDIALGPMSSGKTSFLIQRFEKYSDAKFYKLSLDESLTQATSQNIRSHDNKYEVEGLMIRSLEQVSLSCSYLFIDEIQFAPIDEVQNFLEKTADIQIYFGGLDYDWQIEWFESTKYLVLDCPRVRNIHKLKARCYLCDAPAPYSKKLSSSKKRLEEGGLELYKPACQDCYQKNYLEEEIFQQNPTR